MHLEDQLIKIRRPQLHFQLSDVSTPTPTLDSYVGGMPYLLTQERCPVCSLCKKDLTFIFQLRLPNKDDINLYVFFYCFECQKTSGTNGFHVNKYKNPTIENALKTAHFDITKKHFRLSCSLMWSLPVWEVFKKDYPEFGNTMDRTFPVDAGNYYDLVCKDILKEDHKENLNLIGGYPQFLTHPLKPECNCCVVRKPLSFLMQMDSHFEYRMRWKDDGVFYLYQCPTTSKLSFFIQH